MAGRANGVVRAVGSGERQHACLSLVPWEQGTRKGGALVNANRFALVALLAVVVVPGPFASAEEEPRASSVTPQPGLPYVFFNDAAMKRPARTGLDPQVNLDTGNTINDFAQHWTGRIAAPCAGPVHFRAEADNGLRSWIAGRLVIDASSEQGNQEGSATFAQEGALVPFECEFFQSSGVAFARLYWCWEGHPWELIPAVGVLSHRRRREARRSDVERRQGSRGRTGCAAREFEGLPVRARPAQDLGENRYA